MQKKKIGIKRLCVYLIIFVLAFLFFNNLLDLRYNTCNISVDIEGTEMGNSPIEIFYILEKGEFYKQENMVGFKSENPNQYSYNGSITLPVKNPVGFRIDLGNGVNSKIVIKKLSYRDNSGYYNFVLDELDKFSLHDLIVEEASKEKIVLATISSDNISQPDPYIEINNLKTVPFKNYNKIFSAGISLIFTLCIYKFIKLKSIYLFFADLIHSRKLIFSLAKNDFKTKYAGSYFGILWAFVQPICTILVFWFVFQVGFRNGDVGDVPFICWFTCGLIPWFFFSDAWNGATNCLVEYSFLVKKVVFKVYILPFVKIISTFFIHIFFVVFMMLIFVYYKIMPNFYWFQAVYYCFCMMMLLIALSFITVSLVVFFKDLGQIMGIILQFGMWLTPIMWSIDIIPTKFVWLFKLNPMFYVVQGYRDSFIYNVPFYLNIGQTIYFWIIVILLLFIGGLLFKNLKPHFADVL